jgi:hypothetical protein
MRAVMVDGHSSMDSSLKMATSSQKTALHILVRPRETNAVIMSIANPILRFKAHISLVKAMETLLREK